MTTNDLKYELDEICKNYGSADVRMLLVRILTYIISFTKSRQRIEEKFGNNDEFYHYYDGQVSAFWIMVKEMVEFSDYEKLQEMVRKHTNG